MKTNPATKEEYYKTLWCVKCKKRLFPKELAARKKEGFLRLCGLCYTPIKESLKRCLPLMQKLKMG